MQLVLERGFHIFQVFINFKLANSLVRVVFFIVFRDIKFSVVIEGLKLFDGEDFVFVDLQLVSELLEFPFVCLVAFEEQFISVLELLAYFL